MTGTRYQVHIQDSDGSVIEGAELEVRDQDSNSLVTIWDNRATTTTKTNPTTSNANGYAYFYRTGGRYKITVTSGAFSQTFQDVPLGNSQEYDVGTSAGTLVLYENFASVAFDGLYSSLTGTPTLGTMAALDSGTGGSNFRTNTQNDARFLQVANNLNDVTASSARANLDLSNIYSLEGVVTNTHIPLKRAGAFVDSPLSFDGNDAATFGGNGPTTFNHDVDIDGALTVDTIDTGQGAVECYAMDQAVRTTDTPTFGNATADGHALNRVTADGRYGQLGTANSWTGDQDITGAIAATEDSAIGKTATSGVRLDVEGAGILAARFKNTDTTDGFGVKINAGGSSAGRYALLVANAADDTNYLRVSTETGNVGKLEALAGLDVTGAISATGNIGSTNGDVSSARTTGAGFAYIGNATGVDQYQYVGYGSQTAGQKGWQLGKADNSGTLAPDGSFFLYDFLASAKRLHVTSTELAMNGAISATTGVTPAASQDAITAWKNRTAYTPTVSGSGGSAGSFAATTTAGEYIRYGDLCIAKIRLDTITDKGSWTGDVRFSLPFAAVSNGSVFGGGTIETMEQHSFTGQLSAFTLNGQSYTRIRTFSSAGTPGYLQWADLTTAAGNDIAFTVIYTVA